MKHIFIAAAFVTTLTFQLSAQSLKVPAPSPTQTIKQDFGLSTIELSYSRPGVKGRTIYGDVVPFNAVWRTGANAATTITFGDTVMIDNKKVSPGKYGLLTIPGKDEWTMIISKSTTTNSPADYKQEEDVLRAKVKPQMISDNVETFTMNLGNIKSTSCDLQLIWEKTMVSLPITTDIDKKIMGDIKNMVIGDSKPYFAAANYYQDNNKDLNQALIWYDKAFEANPKGYYILYQKANCLAKLGRKKEALTVSQQSLNLAKEEQNMDYVHNNERLQKTLQ